MSDNEQRIRAWREQRQAGILPTDPQATARALAFNRAAALVGNPSVGVRAIIQIALDGLPAFSGAERRELYDRIYDGLKAGISDRGLSTGDGEYWTRRATAAIRALEADVRGGADVFAPGYLPQGLAESDAKLRARHRIQLRRAKTDKARQERRRATREDTAHEIALPPEDVADLARLRPALAFLHASQRPTAGGTVPRFLTVGPLLYLQLLVIQSDSRIALLWSFVGPVILMTIISSIYILNGVNFVLGMPVIAFTLSGAVVWVMFRQIVFRSSAAYLSSRLWLSLRPASPLLLALASSTVYMCVYIFVLTVIVGAGHYLWGLFSIPDNIPAVLACIVGIAIMAASFGLFFAAIATKWDYFMRFAPAIERALQIVSSVFFVSEQLPFEYRKYFLWSPLGHGFQLLRSAWFINYKSQDASLVYFLASIVAFVVVGLISDRLARPNINPV
jgi:ABC-type polysaccharide/polyol phosphate export permease